MTVHDVPFDDVGGNLASADVRVENIGPGAPSSTTLRRLPWLSSLRACDRDHLITPEPSAPGADETSRKRIG